MPDVLDDAACVARCLRGDAAAFEPLVERYERVLFGVALRLLGNRDDACDAVQAAFVRAYQRLDRYDPSRKFFSWMYRIAVNECLNAVRARRTTEQIDPATPVEPVAFAGVQTRELRDDIQAALMQLTAEQRRVVVLRHFAELSYEDVAAALGLPVKTVRSRLFAARQRLAGLLVPPGARRQVPEHRPATAAASGAAAVRRPTFRPGGV
jgi:RNA polymerase sigma-70 factor (ECF subfamily)